MSNVQQGDFIRDAIRYTYTFLYTREDTDLELLHQGGNSLMLLLLRVHQPFSQGCNGVVSLGYACSCVRVFMC